VISLNRANALILGLCEFWIFLLLFFFFYLLSLILLFNLLADSLTVQSLLELVDEESLRKDTALPSPEWSSDHIALLAEFRCKPKLKH
jgi:mRNA deadenylase 3'-5' endonuclease subunit Ccr4